MKNFSAPTLHTILILAWIPDLVSATCVAGRLPRSFGNRDITFAWKIRDIYYELAEASVCGTEEIKLAKILFRIMPEWSMSEFALPELTATAQQVCFQTITYKNYQWQSPTIYYGYSRELLTAVRLYYLYTIWQNNPSFLEADFSSAILYFDNDAVAQVLVGHEPTSRKPTVIERKLLEFLSEEPRLRREIESYMNVNRSNLLTNYLYPAREAGWITTTDTITPSSPTQRYMLTEAGKQAIANN